jgi:hypothetical protein
MNSLLGISLKGFLFLSSGAFFLTRSFRTDLLRVVNENTVGDNSTKERQAHSNVVLSLVWVRPGTRGRGLHQRDHEGYKRVDRVDNDKSKDDT